MTTTAIIIWIPVRDTFPDSYQSKMFKSHTSSYIVVGNFTFISFNIISFKIAGLDNTNVRSISSIDSGLTISGLTPRDVVTSFIIDISNDIKRRGH